MSQPKRKTTSTRARKKVDEPKPPTSPSPTQEGSSSPSTTRAEEMFNQAGQRIREFTTRLTTPSQGAPPHTKSTNQSSAGHALASGLDTERAEQMMTSAEERIGRFAARLAACTREEVEDIWAEAQSIRHKGQT